MALLAALVIGLVAGLRTFTAPTAVSWAARLGWLPLQGSSLAWLGTTPAAVGLTVLALVEFVVDQLPMTPSRTVPPQFAARLVNTQIEMPGLHQSFELTEQSGTC